MERNGNPSNAVVIGGGIAGLAAAAYLARDGHRVAIVERAGQIGGLARTTEHGGTLYNMGPHAFFRGGAGESVVHELGVPFSGNSPSGMGVALRRGRTSVLPRDARTMLGSRLFRVRDRAEVANRMMVLRSGDPERLRGRTVERYLREELAFDVSREYITAVIRLATYAHAPHLIDMADAAVQMRGGFAGVTYMDGGWQTLVNGLESAAGAAGVEILTGAPAARVEPGPGGAVILRDGRRLPADAIVLAVPPAVAAELLPVAATRQWADAAIPSRVACLDVTLRGLPRPRRLFGLGVDEPFYLSVHTNFAQLAPAGLATVTVARYLAPGEQPGADALLRQLEGLLDRVQPGWRSREVHRQFLPSMTAATAMPLASAGGIPGRPGPAVPETDGVFVAGDWVGPSGWLADAALGSARRAAREASRWLSTAPRREPVLAGD